jgi:hypothetical protein
VVFERIVKFPIRLDSLPQGDGGLSREAKPILGSTEVPQGGRGESGYGAGSVFLGAAEGAEVRRRLASAVFKHYIFFGNPKLFDFLERIDL